MRDLLLSILLSTALGVNAQWWEHAYQPSEEVRMDQVLPVTEGRWAVFGRPTYAGTHMVRVYNADGSLAWEQSGPYGNGQGLGDVVLLPDSSLLQVGAFDQCDYIGPDSRVSRIAADGTVLWQRYITPSTGYFPTMAAKGTVDRIALASQDSVWIMDLEGNAVGGFQVPAMDVRRIHWASDNTLFLVSGTQLKRVDVQGATSATTAIGPNVQDMHWDGQQLFVLMNGNIHRFDHELVALGVDPVAGLNSSSRFVTAEYDLFVNTTTGLFEVGDDGVTTLVSPWPALPQLTTSGCAVRNGTVLSTGHTSISGRRTGIVRTHSMEGDAAQHEQDVEVLLRVDSAWTQHLNVPIYSWDRKADVTGLVVNHGSDTLRSVVVSMWVSTPYIFCSREVVRIDTSGLALAPGDTIVLPFGVVPVAKGLTQSQVVADAGEICFVALAPDLLADRAPGDNTACVPVDFVLGLHAEDRHATLSVFPNPAAGQCRVTGLAGLGGPVHMRILDLAGRIVLERSGVLAENSMVLDIHGLPTGTYVLQAQGAVGRAVLKLVVAHS